MNISKILYHNNLELLHYCGLKYLGQITVDSTESPYTLTVGGGYVPPLFHLLVLCVRHRPGMRGPGWFPKFSA